jgi:hypothetical protein
MSTSTDSGKGTNYYQLLKLKPFETDQEVIRTHFHKLVAQVRAKIAAEPYAPKWKSMLNEITRAMLVLTEARRKADYDAQLGHPTPPEAKPLPLLKLLRQRKLLDDTALERAKKFAETINIDLHEAITQQKLLAADVVMPLYADSLGLPFVQLADMTIDEGLISTVPALMARQNSLTPVMMDGGFIVIASPKPIRPEIEEQLRLRFDSSVRQVICTKAAIDEAISTHYPREAAAAQMTRGADTQDAPGKKGTDAKAGAAKRISREELRSKKLKIGFIAAAFSTMAIVFGGQLFTDLAVTNPYALPVGGLCVGAVAFLIGFFVVNE